MSMRRDDFETVARAIKTARADAPDATPAIDAVARSLALAFVREYSAFQSERFLNACGMEDNQ